MPMGRANGSAGSAEVNLKVRKPGGGYLSERTYTATTSFAINPPLDSPIEIIGGSDIKVTVRSVSDNDSQFSGDFDLRIVKN